MSLAGYRGTNLAELDNRVFTGSTFKVTEGVAGAADSVTVRYYEDRWTETGATNLVEVTFTARNNELIRQDLSDDSSFAIAEGIADLQVAHYYNLQGAEFQIGSGLATEDLGGIGVEMTYKSGDKEELIIGFINSQQASLGQ